MEKDERQTEGGTRESLSLRPEAKIWYDDELRQHRRRIVLIAVPGLVGTLATIAAVFPAPEMYGLIELAYVSGGLQIIALSSFVVCGFAAVLMYLQTGFRPPPRPSDDGPSLAAWPSGEIDDELVQRVRERIDAKVTEQYLDEIRLAVGAAERRAQPIARLEGTIERLSIELDALTRRGNFNLVAGSFVALGGMGLLGYFVYVTTSGVQPGVQPDANGWDFIKRFVPQLSLVTIVEVFAYFFLRLYSRSLTEIKYFQNEISNFEAKLTSVWTAVESDDQALVGDIVRELARTERNHILKKGETTVAADQRRTDEAAGLSLAKALTTALRSDRSREA